MFALSYLKISVPKLKEVVNHQHVYMSVSDLSLLKFSHI